jgi:flagellar basal-body rod protein FlgF
MLRGLYTSAAGMLGQLDRQDAIANNLANADTPGYKRQVIAFSGFSTQLQNALQTQDVTLRNVVPLPSLYADAKQGGLQDTGSKTNFALMGPGSFAVQTGSGEQLVRAGIFQLDGKGQIVNSNGDPVLGERGPIQITGADWSVDTEGNVSVGSSVVDKLKIVNGSTDPKKPTQVVQGSLESSNVNTVEEMVSMITALRSYEACQKTIQSLDGTLDKLINQMGK